jgi:hypothetical protein
MLQWASFQPLRIFAFSKPAVTRKLSKRLGLLWVVCSPTTSAFENGTMREDRRARWGNWINTPPVIANDGIQTRWHAEASKPEHCQSPRRVPVRT